MPVQTVREAPRTDPSWEGADVGVTRVPATRRCKAALYQRKLWVGDVVDPYPAAGALTAVAVVRSEGLVVDRQQRAVVVRDRVVRVLDGGVDDAAEDDRRQWVGDVPDLDLTRAYRSGAESKRTRLLR